MKLKEAENIKIGESLSIYSNEEFTNKTKKIIKADELTFIGKGKNSSVWKYSSNSTISAFKIFFEKCNPWSLQMNSFKVLKNLELQRIVNVIDGFYKTNNYKQENLDAYLMTYLEENCGLSIIDIPTSNLLESAELLDEDVKTLTKNRIKMNDVKKENSIITQDFNFYLSDFDMFEVFSPTSEDQLLQLNYKRIYWIFEEYLTKELENLEIIGELTSEEHTKAYIKVNDILDPFKISDIGIANCLEEIFGNYETPKEYFLSMRK